MVVVRYFESQDYVFLSKAWHKTFLSMRGFQIHVQTKGHTVHPFKG